MGRKRIYELDQKNVAENDDRFVVDESLGGGLFKTKYIDFADIKASIVGGFSGLLLETGDHLLLEDGFKLLLEESSQGIFEPIVETNDTALSLFTYHRITDAGTYTLPSASDFDGTIQCRVDIKNISGGDITINADGSDTIYEFNGTVTTFDLADGEFVRLICGSTNQWDIN